MFMRGVRVTFTNQLMKESVSGTSVKWTDRRHDDGVPLSLPENQLLNIMLFPDEDTANRFGESPGPISSRSGKQVQNRVPEW